MERLTGFASQTTLALIEDREAHRSRHSDLGNSGYIGWTTRAKRGETRKRRLTQMLDELRSGDHHMKTAYQARTR